MVFVLALFVDDAQLPISEAAVDLARQGLLLPQPGTGGAR